MTAYIKTGKNSTSEFNISTMNFIKRIGQTKKRENSSKENFFSIKKLVYAGFLVIFFSIIITIYSNSATRNCYQLVPYKTSFSTEVAREIKPASGALNKSAHSLILEARKRQQEGKTREAEILFNMAASINPHAQELVKNIFRCERTKKFDEVLEKAFSKLSDGKIDEAWAIFDENARNNRDFFLYGGEFFADSLKAYGQTASSGAILATLNEMQPENARVTQKLAEIQIKLRRP
ncbi:MAG: hypothetical protein Kow0029_25070 [Candidatus Rifleibacteriota bacterium]